jgi:hypothetical protein
MEVHPREAAKKILKGREFIRDIGEDEQIIDEIMSQKCWSSSSIEKPTPLYQKNMAKR